MSTTCSVAGVLLARARSSARAWRRRTSPSRVATTDSARRLAGRGVDAAGDVGGDDRHVEHRDRLDRVRRRRRAARRRSRCRRSRRRRPRRRRAPPASNGSCAPSSRRRFSAASPLYSSASASSRTRTVAAQLAQQARRRRGRRRRCCPCRRRSRSARAGRGGRSAAPGPAPGALHEVQRRHAALLDRPAVGRAHLLGAGQRLEPVGQRRASRPHERDRARGHLGVRHRDVDLHAERGELAVQRDARRGALADDLDVVRVPRPPGAAPSPPPPSRRSAPPGAGRAAPAPPRTRARRR